MPLALDCIVVRLKDKLYIYSYYRDHSLRKLITLAHISVLLSYYFITVVAHVSHYLGG